MKRILFITVVTFILGMTAYASNNTVKKVTRSGDTIDVQLVAEGNISLYSGESQVLPATIPEDPTVPYTKSITTFYLSQGNDHLTEVHCGNYRKVLRTHMQDKPEIAEKIGKKGYKFNDLEGIVQAYNR